MNVLFVSECSGKALKETRRILDQFAERRGERTWQTPITQDGLEAVRKLLRKSARKNTAVACHWIRGRDHSELLWVVGNARQFNFRGAVPTNTTTRKRWREDQENNWHTLRDIYLIASLAALLHDLGKSCSSFQDRLKNDKKFRNVYRHEWISLRLFQAFVGNDDDATWLARMVTQSPDDDARWIEQLEKDGIAKNVSKPFETLGPLAQAIGWLVLTHHRLPEKRQSADEGWTSGMFDSLPGCITADWNEDCTRTEGQRIESYWDFPNGLPVATKLWRERASKIAKRLQERQSKTKESLIDSPFVMHLSRLCLMLADHHYSSLTNEGRIKCDPSYPILANTRKDGPRRVPNQPLDEHLIGVERFTGQAVFALPEIVRNLPRLQRHRGLRQRTSNELFRWQDKAAELAASMRNNASQHGAFIVNMASTGCGKTLANARIMYALTDENVGMRCSFALGLRTLTRQTAQEYRHRLNLSEQVVAMLVGGISHQRMLEKAFEEAETTGSESRAELLSEDEDVEFEGGAIEHPSLKKLCSERKALDLLSAPILVSTIDQLMPATESTRGGHQILPMLRLLSSDLVLDEIDDYSIEDLHAVTRLMNWAGMLGCRVLISSATISPALVQGMFSAYLAGRTEYQRNRGERPREKPDICCMWVDEFNCMSEACATAEAMLSAHQRFVSKRVEKLSEASALRRAEIEPITVTAKEKSIVRKLFAEKIRECALRLHSNHHALDPMTGRKVSFGLVRMANIDPLVDVAMKLYRAGAPENHRIHLCVYHSQHPLIVRTEIERVLDRVLSRRDPNAIYNVDAVRKAIDSSTEENHLFIVLSSPIAEVGRDHDYDWAVIEPSSMRSIIQIAGRVQRHRKRNISSANIFILERNIRSCENPEKPAYCRPGFEACVRDRRLVSHSLVSILQEAEFKVIDARPRVIERANLQPRNSLVDLEHYSLRAIMVPQVRQLSEEDARAGASAAPKIGAYSWWLQPRVSLTAILQRRYTFRKESEPRVEVVLMPIAGGADYRFVLRFESNGSRFDVPVERKMERISDKELSGPRIQPWAHVSYLDSLGRAADALQRTLEDCANQLGFVNLPDEPEGWRSHSWLGFSRKNE